VSTETVEQEKETVAGSTLCGYCNPDITVFRYKLMCNGCYHELLKVRTAEEERARKTRWKEMVRRLTT
jgi:hypothetical protein